MHAFAARFQNLLQRLPYFDEEDMLDVAKRDPYMGKGCGQQGVLLQGSVVGFLSFISRLMYWGVGQYYDEEVDSLGMLF